MTIDHKEIALGKLNGLYVWVCDFRYADFDDKPIRNVPPTIALIRDNSKAFETVYYSDSHFAVPLKTGKGFQSKIIKLYDNTGFRSRTGTPLQVFEFEEECRTCYNNMRREAADEMERWLNAKVVSYRATIDALRK